MKYIEENEVYICKEKCNTSMVWCNIQDGIPVPFTIAANAVKIVSSHVHCMCNE